MKTFDDCEGSPAGAQHDGDDAPVSVPIPGEFDVGPGVRVTFDGFRWRVRVVEPPPIVVGQTWRTIGAASGGRPGSSPFGPHSVRIESMDVHTVDLHIFRVSPLPPLLAPFPDPFRLTESALRQHYELVSESP